MWTTEDDDDFVDDFTLVDPDFDPDDFDPDFDPDDFDPDSHLNLKLTELWTLWWCLFKFAE